MKTFIQKAVESSSTKMIESIIKERCPSHFDLERESNCSVSSNDCEACWNRAFPEPVETIPRFRVLQGDVEVSYDNGDSWIFLTYSQEGVRLRLILSKVLSAAGAKYVVETFEGELTHEDEGLR